MPEPRHPQSFGDTSHGPDVGQNLVNWLNNASGAVTGFLKNPLSGIEHPTTGGDGGGGDSSGGVNPKDLKAAEKFDKTPMTQPPTPLATDIGAYMKPLTSELNALPGEYSKVMSQINAMPDSGTATPVNPAVADLPGEAANKANEAALSKAEGATTADLESGEGAIQKALGAEGKAAKTLVKDLPYADILATSLMQKKNELLYGTTITTPPLNETGWNQNFKDLYSYIHGGTGGNTLVAGGDKIPGIAQIANQQSPPPGQNFDTQGKLGGP
jgi:hypothetical protein